MKIGTLNILESQAVKIISDQHAIFSSGRPLTGRHAIVRPSGPRTAWAIVVIAGALAASPGRGQQPAVVLEIPSTTLEVGEVLDAKVVCTNTPRPDPPTFTAPAGLTVELLNSNPASSSMTSIVNGRATHRTTYTFGLRLIGAKAGKYILTPMTIQAEGQTFQTQPVTILVREPAAAQPDGDQEVFVKIAVEPQSLYVTQSLTATLTIGIRRVYINGQVVDYDNLLQTVDARGSALSVFGPQFRPSEMTIADSSGQRHQYLVFRDTKEIRAQEVGVTEIGPVFLRVNYPTSFRRSFWGMGYEPANARRVTARAEAVTVEVKAPPLADRPADFTGAIGQFTVSAAAKPDRVQQGQPVTLSFTVQGGNVEGVAGPNLVAQSELASRFDFAGDELSGDVEGSSKVFRRAIFPRQAGEQTIPPLTWSYFDPEKEQYVTLRTEPIPLLVTPGTEADPAATNAAADPQSTSLTLLRGGLSPNYVDPSQLLADHSFNVPRPALMVTLAVPPLVWLATLIAATRRRRVQSDAGYGRRRNALRHARRALAAAMRQPEPHGQLHGLAAAITDYLSNRYDLPPGILTSSEAAALIAAKTKDAALAASVADFLNACDAVRYAPASVLGLHPAEAHAQVQQWLTRIERNGAVCRPRQSSPGAESTPSRREVRT